MTFQAVALSVAQGRAPPLLSSALWRPLSADPASEVRPDSDGGGGGTLHVPEHLLCDRRQITSL